MLQRAAAAPPEMAAYRLSAGRPGGKALHHPALSPGTATWPDFSADPVAGDSERQEHKLAAPLSDPITLRAEPVDGEFDEFAAGSPLRSPLHRSDIR
jgi:hypothetical protein